MNIPSSPIKENLIAFFQDCNELLTKHDLQCFKRRNVRYKFTRINLDNYTLSSNCDLEMQWHLVKSRFQEDMKNIESINFCVENLIEYFGLPYANKELYQSDNVVESSRDEYKQQLIILFFKYKELQEENNLSIPDYVILLIKGVWSKNVYFKTTAQLIGLNTELEKIKIQNVTIRLPTEEELTKIINDNDRSLINLSYPPEIASCGLNILLDTHYWVFMEIQQTRLEKLDTLYTVRSLYTQKELLYNKDDDANVIPEFKRLILALRLYNGNYIGIRSLFIKKSFVYESDRFEPWREYPFLNSDFGHFRKACYSIDLKKKKIQSDDVKEINNIFRDLMLYEQNPLKQIDCALDHYFEAFEQIYPVYIFTELIMAFETLFHKDKTTSNDASIKILNQLLPSEKKGKKVKKFFYNNDNNGCYQIRHGLLHGDINLDSKEIRKKIPDLEEYVRLALLKVIELRINDKLDCNEENYFEKLNQTLKVNFCGSSKIKKAKSNI